LKEDEEIRMTRNIHTMTTMTTPATGLAATNARADEAASRELFAARAELASQTTITPQAYLCGRIAFGLTTKL